jgi:hypothetical protein
MGMDCSSWTAETWFVVRANDLRQSRCPMHRDTAQQRDDVTSTRSNYNLCLESFDDKHDCAWIGAHGSYNVEAKVFANNK